MPPLDNTPPQADQYTWPVTGSIGLLTALEQHGLIAPAGASDLKGRAALGLLSPDAMRSEAIGLLAAGSAPDKALNTLAAAFLPGGLIELRALDPAGGGGLSLSGRLDVTAERAALAAFVRDHNGRSNLYFGVNPRALHMAGSTNAAKAADVAARRIVVLDLDRKDAPPNDPDWSQTIAALQALHPIMVLDSGNGVHVWLAVQSISDADLQASIQPLAGAMARLGADNMADLPRIARLPFTINLPNAAKRARGNTPRLALPVSPPPLRAMLRPAPPALAALCAGLDDVATRLALPGKTTAPGLSGTGGRPAAGAGQVKTGEPAPSADLLRRALVALPNDQGGPFDDRQEWVSVGHAAKGAAVAGGFEAEGRDAWLEWSAQWGGDPAAAEQFWDTADAHTGWGTLMQTLERVNPAGRDTLRADEARAAFGAAATAAMARFATPLQGAASQIPPRQWLYGRNVIAGFVSMLVAPGGAGKSALMMAEVVAMVTGRELLAGDKPVKPLRVWAHNAEDDLDEMRRRLAGTLIHYGLTHADLNGNLTLTSGRDLKIQLARLGRNGLEILPGVVDGIVEQAKALGVNVIVLDPLGAMHSVPENSNEAANLLLGALREIADRTGAAIILVHHAGKQAATDMGTAGAAASRGASAFVDGARVVWQLVPVTDKEAARFGIAEDDRGQYMRVATGKANLAPAGAARWVRLRSVRLNNCTPEYPDGDWVGVPERWTPPGPVAGTASDLYRVQAAITAASDAGNRPRFDVRSKEWVGWLVAEVLGLDAGRGVGAAKDRTPAQNAAHHRVRSMVEGWLADGGLRREDGTDPGTRKTATFVTIGKPAMILDDPQDVALVEDADAENNSAETETDGEN